MALRHAAQLPQGFLQAGAETLKAFGKTQAAGLPIRVGQHKVVEQMCKRLTLHRDAQARQVAKVRRTQLPGPVFLSKENFFGRPFERSPDLELTLQGA